MPNVPMPTTSNPFGYCYHSDPFVKVTPLTCQNPNPILTSPTNEVSVISLTT